MTLHSGYSTITCVLQVWPFQCILHTSSGWLIIDNCILCRGTRMKQMRHLLLWAVQRFLSAYGTRWVCLSLHWLVVGTSSVERQRETPSREAGLQSSQSSRASTRPWSGYANKQTNKHSRWQWRSAQREVKTRRSYSITGFRHVQAKSRSWSGSILDWLILFFMEGWNELWQLMDLPARMGSPFRIFKGQKPTFLSRG